jgi:hypothetical protein
MNTSPKVIKTASIALILLIVALSIALLAEKKDVAVATPAKTEDATSSAQDIVKAPVTKIDPKDVGMYVSASGSYELELLDDNAHSARFTDASATEPIMQAGVWESKDDGSVFISLFNKGGEGQPPVYLHFKKNGDTLTLEAEGSTAGITALTLARSAS